MIYVATSIQSAVILCLFLYMCVWILFDFTCWLCYYVCFVFAELVVVDLFGRALMLLQLLLMCCVRADCFSLSALPFILYLPMWLMWVLFFIVCFGLVFTTCVFDCYFIIFFLVLCYVVVVSRCFLRSFVCLLSCCHMLLNVCVVCVCFCLIAIVVFVDVFLLRFNFRDSVFAVIDCYVCLLRSVLLLLLIAFVVRLFAFVYIYISDFMCAYFFMCMLRY